MILKLKFLNFLCLSLGLQFSVYVSEWMLVWDSANWTRCSEENFQTWEIAGCAGYLREDSAIGIGWTSQVAKEKVWDGQNWQIIEGDHNPQKLNNTWKTGTAIRQSQDYPCHCNIRNTWCGCGGSKTETTRENIIGAGCLIGKRLRLTKEGTRMKTRVKKWEKKKVIIYIYIVHLLLSRAWSLQLHKDHKSSWGHVMWYLLPCYGVHGGAGNLPWVTEKKTGYADGLLCITTSMLFWGWQRWQLHSCYFVIFLFENKIKRQSRGSTDDVNAFQLLLKSYRWDCDSQSKLWYK